MTLCVTNMGEFDVDSSHLLHGITLFNRGEFFEAHEVLEDVWRAAPESDKKFLQGLIQVAVALHHHSKGNLVGAQSLLERAARNLAPYPKGFGGINVAALLCELSEWQRCLKTGVPLPPLPRL